MKNNTRHYFLLNPAAGQGKALGLEKKIWKAADEVGIEPVIHITKYPGEAEEYIRSVCEEVFGENDQLFSPGEEERSEGANPGSTPGSVLRFYACGGDGTFNEVVNGCYGFMSEKDGRDKADDGNAGCGRGFDRGNIEVANIPVGTGNDFIRNFDDAGDFSNIALQLRSSARPCDLIRYSGMCDGAYTTKYSANMFNIGFDCNVVDKTDSLKKKPLLFGPMAYLAGVGIMLIRKEGADLKVEFDDGFVYDGKMLLIAIANGCFCGGGVKGIPKAVTDDGLIDVSLIKDTSRRNFVRLFPKYSKGTHLEDPRTDELIIYKKCKSLTVTPNNDEMKLCIDGEISMAGEMKFEIVPGAIRFVVPDHKEEEGK